MKQYDVPTISELGSVAAVTRGETAEFGLDGNFPFFGGSKPDPTS